MSNSGGDPRKLTHKQEVVAYLLEWFPELLLLLTDILILGASGNADKIAGASVAGIIMGALARVVRAPSGCCQKLAERHADRRRELLSLNYVWVLLSALLLSTVWLASVHIEDFVGLPGMAEYILFAAPASLMIRLQVVGHMAMGTNQARVGPRIGLAWLMSASNVGLTYLVVDIHGMGASGASLGTLLAEIIPTFLVLRWAHKDELLGRVNLQLLPFVWEKAKKKTYSELPAMLGSVAAVMLNRWMGESLARQWTYAQTCCDVVGGFGLCIWGVTSKHFTYNLADKIKRSAVWRFGDHTAWVVTIVGALGSWFVAPIAPFVVVAYCVAKRNQFKCDRWADQRGFDAQANGKLAYTVTCVIGYGMLVCFVEPNLWAAVAIYCCAQSANYFAAHASNS